ncbi:MAG: CxxC-x17-CxxC domain-containing protein [Candidatus Magasanikbacteria bacterium]
MGHFDRNNRGAGGFNNRNSGGGSFNRGGDRPQMHDATCKKCGNYCQVPFRPTGSKPVFCSDCFGKQNDGGRGSFGGRGDRKFGNKKSFGGSQNMHPAVCDTCGNDCEVPFRPTGDKPIYCSNCFGKDSKSGGSSKGGSCNCSPEIKKLEGKIDSILKTLGIPEPKKYVAPIKPEKKKEESKKAVPAKTEKKEVDTDPKPKKVKKTKVAPKKVKKAVKKKAATKKKK